MNSSLLVMWLLYLPIAALCIAQPWFSRRNVLFSVVFGNTEVWNQPEMRAVRRKYFLWSVLVCVIIGAAGLFWSLHVPVLAEAGIYTGAIFVMLGIETVFFVIAHARVRRFKTTQQPDSTLVRNTITVETGMPERQAVLSAAWTLLLVPLAGASALLAIVGYPDLPARIPTHFNLAGVPNAFTEKSWPAVLFLVFLHFAVAGIIAISFLFARRAPASVRGNPQAAPGSIRYRKVMSFLLLATGMLAQVIFLLIQIRELVVFPMVWVSVLGILCVLSAVLMVIVYVCLVRAKQPRGKIMDDDAKWVLGLFYYNPGDPSVFVEKRAGIGYTLNYARPLAWIFTVGIAVFVIVVLAFSFHSK